MWRCLSLALSSVLLAAGAFAASPENYPTKPIKLIVPFGAGSGSDFRGRITAEYMAKSLGQPIIVDNQPGAQGLLGAGAAARSAPDGYTLLLGGVTINAANARLFKKLPYDMKNDFEPISKLGSAPFVLVVGPASPFHSVQDVISSAKSTPGTLSFASGSAASRVAAEMFRTMTGQLDLIYIPYKGNANSLVDIIAGRVNMSFVDLTTALPNIQDGQLRPLAVTSKERSRFLTTVPTMIEAGVAGYELTGWSAMYAPARTPPAIIAKLNQAIVRAFDDSQFQQALLKSGAEAEVSSPSELATFTLSEVVKWSTAIRAAKIEPD
jgi:tripartite-type tricarboxylate transporter receptor subunit TctC